MKHIGLCLEKIQIVMSNIPRSVESPENKRKANRILDEVEKYKRTLIELIDHPKFERYL